MYTHSQPTKTPPNSHKILTSNPHTSTSSNLHKTTSSHPYKTTPTNPYKTTPSIFHQNIFVPLQTIFKKYPHKYLNTLFWGENAKSMPIKQPTYTLVGPWFGISTKISRSIYTELQSQQILPNSTPTNFHKLQTPLISNRYFHIHTKTCIRSPNKFSLQILHF